MMNLKIFWLREESRGALAFGWVRILRDSLGELFSSPPGKHSVLEAIC
jgi:hypothetical protein